MTAPYVITVGRSLGSGGREIGQLLAERLGIGYYDRRLIDEAAAHAGLSADIVGASEERHPTISAAASPLTYGLAAIPWWSERGGCDDDVYRAQASFITKVASETPCVIVGRSADYTLRNHPGLIRLFVHASDEACVQRILTRGDAATPEAALKLIRKVNKMRAGYYNFYTDKEWGRASSYDLTLDTSRLTSTQAVDLLCQYIAMRLSNA